jgi:hypothetical protein
MGGATDQAGNLHNGIRRSAMSEEGSLLEELRTAYRGLGRKERQQVKTLLLTLGRATAIYRERRQPQSCLCARQDGRPIQKEDVWQQQSER